MNETLGIRLALAFGDLAMKSFVILGIAWLVTSMLRRKSAATRHFVWLSAFLAVILLPLLVAVMPLRPIAVGYESVPQRPAPPQRVRIPAPELGSISSAALEELLQTMPKTSNQKLEAPGVPKTTTTSASNESALNLPVVWALIAGIWFFGGLALAIQSFLSLWAVQLWKRSSSVVRFNDENLDVNRLSRRVGMKRIWDLRLSAGPKPPAAMTWGFMKPVVLMPKESANWSIERLEAVLLHELAHVRRFDSVSQLIAAVGCTIYWFNPAVWLCARAMRAEAETAADDMVLGLGVKPSAYAQHLLEIAAELGQRRQPLSLIGVPVMKQSKIESRVRAILNPSNRHRRGVTSASVLITSMVVGILIIPLGILRASIVSQPHLRTSEIESVASLSRIAVPNPPTGDVQITPKSVAPLKASDSKKRVANPRHYVALSQVSATQSVRTAMSEVIGRLTGSTRVPQDDSVARRLAEQKQLEADRQKLEAEEKALESEKAQEFERIVKLKAEQAHGANERARAELVAAEARQAQLAALDAKLLRSESETIRRRLQDAQAKLENDAIKSIKARVDAQTSKRMAEMRARNKALLMMVKGPGRLSDVDPVQMSRVKALVTELLEKSEKNNGEFDKQSSEQIQKALEGIAQAEKRAEEARRVNEKIRQVQLEANVSKASIQMALAKKMAAEVDGRYRQGLAPADELEKATEALQLAEIQLQTARKILDAVRSNKAP